MRRMPDPRKSRPGGGGSVLTTMIERRSKYTNRSPWASVTAGSRGVMLAHGGRR